VLFHEIGHHIHFAVRPESREKEDVADVWKVRLQRNYHQQRFSWIRIVSRLVRPLLGQYLERKREKLELEMLKNGQISRAEYQESVAKRQSGYTHWATLMFHITAKPELIQAQSYLVKIGLKVDGQVGLLREVRFNTWMEKNRSAASRCVTVFGASFHRVNMAA
jgi:hypothetical protein